jgi:hypothetical protein
MPPRSHASSGRGHGAEPVLAQHQLLEQPRLDEGTGGAGAARSSCAFTSLSPRVPLPVPALEAHALPDAVALDLLVGQAAAPPRMVVRLFVDKILKIGSIPLIYTGYFLTAILVVVDTYEFVEVFNPLEGVVEFLDAMRTDRLWYPR